MSKYTLMDDVGNVVARPDRDDPDEAIRQASSELGIPLTFDGDGPAPYLLMPTDHTSNLEGDPVIVEPERVVYRAREVAGRLG